MDTPLATVVAGLALAAAAVVLLVAEFILRREEFHRRPPLPPDDQPPEALSAIRVAEVPAEVSRGMAALIRELRRAAPTA